MLISIIYIIAGLLLLFFGGEMLVRGAIRLAENMAIPHFIIGLTVVAIGTSAPEILVSLQAVISGHTDIAIGNIIGSNIGNILLVLGVSVLIFPIIVPKSTREENIRLNSSFLTITVIMLIGFYFDGVITYLEAALLLTSFVIFTIYVLRVSRDGNKERVREAHHSYLTSAIYLILGVVLLVVGSSVMVSGAVDVARIFKVSEEVIGLTIVAIGSSSPELATSVVAAIKKHNSIVIGNIIGSNIMNITIGLGIAGLVSPIAVSNKILSMDSIYLLVSTLFVGLFVYFIPRIGRLVGLLFVLSYISYILMQL